MNLKETLNLYVIQRLIDNKSFEIAIKKIDMLIPTTTCIRRCVNLKVQCLIELENYHDAYELYKDYFPYAMIDTEDLNAIKYLSKVYQHLGNKIQAIKYENSYKILSGTKEERELYLYEQEEKSYHVYNEFLKNNGSTKEMLENIIIDNFQMLRITEAAVYFALAKRIGIDISDNTAGEFSRYTQAEKFTYELSIGHNNKYCVISESASQSNMLRDCCLVKALSLLGTLVYHIIPFYKSDHVDLSIDKCFEMQEYEGNIVKIKTSKSGDRAERGNISDIIKALNNRNDTNNPIILFGESDFLMDINEDVEISKILEMYFRHYEKQSIPRKDCLLLGSYFASMLHIWGYDVQKEFAKDPVCDFSIIIPVRNSIKYLRETIETCLNQDYKGTYEILISDNAWHNNVNVLDLVKSINNEKVRYIRTPFELSLPKSFEFAYLNSRGKYLISLGSDDGLIKTALSVMNATMNKCPDNNVLLWNFALYNWPEYSSIEKNNHTSFSYNLSNSTKLIELETEPLIREYVLGNIVYMSMPMMYLVTCVKREHINKMIEVTGKFEDGSSQDIYTGMANLFIENKITYIDYPLVVAGNSEVSVGLFSEQAIQTMSFLGKRFRSNFYFFRYSNYYSQDYRNLSTITGLGTRYSIYQEYVKVNHYKFKKDYSNKKDILIILYEIHKWLPEKSCDEALYLNQLENVAKSFGDDVYKQYMYDRKKWNIQLRVKQIAKKFVKSKKIRHIFRKIYYSIRKLYSLNNRKHTYPNTNNIFSAHGMNRQTIDIDLSSYNVEGIKCATEYLLDAIGRDMRL